MVCNKLKVFFWSLGSGLDVLVAMGSAEGRAKTVFAHEADDYEATKFLSEEEMEARAEAKENALMDRVQWQAGLNLAQRDLVKTRRTLLKFSRRLDSYMAIVDDDPRMEFDRGFYIRSVSRLAHLLLTSGFFFSYACEDLFLFKRHWPLPAHYHHFLANVTNHSE